MARYRGSDAPLEFLLLIMFFALLPLANAPLDWLSLGLTRGLLRKGLALGGTWWIFVISIADILAAGGLMFPLAAVTAATVSLANWAAVSGGGEALVPVLPLLRGMGNNPTDPAFYWVYLMLFSTLIPSIIHIIGGLVGLALACLELVFNSARRAQEFIETEPGEDVTKDTMIRYIYPAVAATGVMGLVSLFWLTGAAAQPAVAVLFWFAQGLLGTAEWAAGLFPA